MTEIMATSQEGDQRVAEIQSQIRDLQSELSRLQWWVGDLSTSSHINSLQSITEENVPDKLFWWRGREYINKQEVLDVVNALQEPYHTDIANFIRSWDILWLQQYLNWKISSWDVDQEKVSAALRARNIPFNWSIKEDWKFWPQTLETMKFIAKDQMKNEELDTKEWGADFIGEKVEKSWIHIKLIVGLLDWIKWDNRYSGYLPIERKEWVKDEPSYRRFGDRVVVWFFDEKWQPYGEVIVLDKHSMKIWHIHQWKKVWLRVERLVNPPEHRGDDNQFGDWRIMRDDFHLYENQTSQENKNDQKTSELVGKVWIPEHSTEVKEKYWKSKWDKLSTNKMIDKKETIDKKRYWEFDCRYIDKLKNGSELVITSKNQLQNLFSAGIFFDQNGAFSNYRKTPRELQEYNDDFFKTNSLSIKYFNRSNSASTKYHITRVRQSGNTVNVSYEKDTTNRHREGLQMMSWQCLFISTKKWDKVNWNQW